MSRLENLQRISAVFRYALIVATMLVGSALLIAMFTPGQNWVSVGDGQFFELWNDGSGQRLALVAAMAPVAITLILGIYWLQRLFGEYQAGRFFSDGTMHCYLWLVWLKAINFVYGAILPMLLGKLATGGSTGSGSISIDAGTFVELMVLLIIVHLLKEAQQLNDENRAFI